MKRIISVMVALALGALVQSAALAKEGGNAATGAMSPPAGSQAMTNSNGNSSTDRDFGRDRAEDRMSAEGKVHANATHPQKPKKLASAKPAKPRAKPATPPEDDGKA
jgi:hypothetical protein